MIYSEAMHLVERFPGVHSLADGAITSNIDSAAIYARVSEPSTATLPDAIIAGSICAAESEVLRVDALRDIHQVRKPIVRSVAVDMIDRSQWPATIVYSPRSAVSTYVRITALPMEISVTILGRKSWPASITRVPPLVSGAGQPGQIAGQRVVLNSLPQNFGSQYTHTSHDAESSRCGQGRTALARCSGPAFSSTKRESGNAKVWWTSVSAVERNPQ